jgi:GTP-binding protein
LTQAPNLRGLVFLIDSRRQFQDDDKMLLEWVVNRQLPFLVVMTKADKLSHSQLIKAVRDMRNLIFGNEESGDLVPFSATSAMGRKEVLQWIRKAVA